MHERLYKDTFFVISFTVLSLKDSFFKLSYGGGGGRKLPKNCHVLFEWPLLGLHSFKTDLLISIFQEFSLKDFDDLVDGWKIKVNRVDAGDQGWGLFIATKPK